MPRHEPDTPPSRGLREDAAPWFGAALDGTGRARGLVSDRLSELRELAAEDEIAIAPASEEGLMRFLAEEKVAIRPALALLDSGELRALWQAGEDQVGLRFMPNGGVAYVCLARREGCSDLVRAYGVEQADRMMPLIETLGLAALLRG